jgi:hypothetical protein
MSSNTTKRGRDESDDEEEFNEVETKPKSKPATPSEVKSNGEGSAKKQKTATTGGNGEAVFELGGKKKVSVSMFKGRLIVNFREFYEDKQTGEEKPGKTGITLNKDQWMTFKSQVS